MVDNTLFEYVQRSLKEGHPQESIVQSLLLNGWPESSIREVLELVVNPNVPKGPGFINPVAPVIPQTPANYQTRNFRNYPIYSVYSVFLAFVLFFGLLILSNKIISDLIRNFEYSITGQLIFQALIILPFLIAAFALHYGLTGRGEKYKILSMPYYIVSGWLLIKLLFNVSAYILSTQVVYGVYIVLVLVVAVLTGVIFFVQKYLKHKD